MILSEMEQAGAKLLGWKRVLLLAHDRPDGDALGALSAMQAVLESLGHLARVGIYDVVPPRYAFLERAGFTLLSSIPQAEWETRFDGILILDTCSWSQLEPVADFLRTTHLPKLVVDHHATRDDLAGAGGDVQYLIDATASAVCTMLHEWVVAMKWPLPEAAVTGLFSGIATDTGWFRFSSTDPRTLHAAGSLVAAGIRPDVMYGRLMDAYSLARVRLLAGTLQTLQLHGDGQVAMMRIDPEMLRAAGATPADTEDVVNEPLKAREVIASVLLIDAGDGKIRVNFRSKSPEVVGCDLDVSAVAAGFGGGGHRRAAGARIIGSLEQVAGKVAEAMNAAVNAARGSR